VHSSSSYPSSESSWQSCSQRERLVIKDRSRLCAHRYKYWQKTPRKTQLRYPSKDQTPYPSKRRKALNDLFLTMQPTVYSCAPWPVDSRALGRPKIPVFWVTTSSGEKQNRERRSKGVHTCAHQGWGQTGVAGFRGGGHLYSCRHADDSTSSACRASGAPASGEAAVLGLSSRSSRW
jgi:hypothetical protein